MRRKSVEYNTWRNIRQRCRNPKQKKFAYYGSRGIAVCERWDKFENFLADMGRRPPWKHTLDRIDPNKGYEPGNCRWATWTEQQNNKRNSRTLTLNGRTQTVADWAREIGVNPFTIYSRLDMGWSVDRALTKRVNPNYWNGRRNAKAA